jgi:hypothetical protein
MYGRFLPAGGAPVYPKAGLITSIETGPRPRRDFERRRCHPAVVRTAMLWLARSVEQAILRTVQLAFFRRNLGIWPRSHGGADYLTEDELATFAGDRSFPARPWEYFLSRLGARRVS